MCLGIDMYPPPYSRSRWLRSFGLGTCAAVSLVTSVQAGAPAVAAKAPAPSVEAVSWKDHTISPVANPIFFEDAIIRSEIRPIFAYHRIDDGFLGGGDAQLYAVQLRYALTDRLALIATQDGYFQINNDAVGNPEGWMDLALGLKYALIDDEASQFILTPGFTVHVPTGSEDVFQGRGNGEVNAFVSAQKGFGDFHLSGNVGLRIPFDSDEQSLVAHYSVMADYYTCRWFIPFVAFNAFTVVNEGNNIPLTSEGYDVINFGSSAADGVTQGTVAVGFRSRVLDNVDLGFAYEKAVIEPYGLTDDRFTFDVSIRF
jgi:hypothetical protein